MCSLLLPIVQLLLPTRLESLRSLHLLDLPLLTMRKARPDPPEQPARAPAPRHLFMFASAQDLLQDLLKVFLLSGFQAFRHMPLASFYCRHVWA